MAAPFTQHAALSSKDFTAVINLVAGVAVITLLSGWAAAPCGRIAWQCAA